MIDTSLTHSGPCTQESIAQRLLWSAWARLGGFEALDRAVESNDLVRAIKLMNHGVDPAGWAARPVALEAMAEAPLPLLRELLGRGCAPPGLFEERLRAAHPLRRFYPEATDEARASIRAMQEAGITWARKGEQALVAAIGLGPDTISFLISLGAQPDFLNPRQRLAETFSRFFMSGGTQQRNGMFAPNNEDRDFLFAHFERLELAQAARHAPQGASTGSRPRL